MNTLLTVVHIVTCFFLVVVVLLQSGKGADISASLSGSSQTVFGSSGGSNFFTKMTAVLAAIFMITSVILTILATRGQKSIFENAPTTAMPSAPVNPPAAPTTTSDTPASPQKP